LPPATAAPNRAPIAASVAVSLLRSTYVAPLRPKTQSAPLPELPPSIGPPIRAVLAPPMKATDHPSPAVPFASLTVSFFAAAVQVPGLDWIITRTAPAAELSPGAPASAVLPSLETASEEPTAALGVASPARASSEAGRR